MKKSIFFAIALFLATTLNAQEPTSDKGSSEEIRQKIQEACIPQNKMSLLNILQAKLSDLEKSDLQEKDAIKYRVQKMELENLMQKEIKKTA